MWTAIFTVLVIYVLWQAFQSNIIMGVIMSLVLLAFLYFFWYADFCVNKARATYPNDPKKAMKWFERAYKKGMNIGQQQIYAYYLMREGEVEKSEKLYHDLLTARLKPELRFKIRSDYAVLLMKTDRIDEALSELEEITANYNNTTTYGTIGYLYLLKNNRRRAEEFNKEAYSYNNDDPVILDNLVQLYIKMGRYSEAKKYADELLEKKPYFIEAYYDAAFTYLKLGEIDTAKEIFEKGKNCRITFMSTIKEDDIAAFQRALDAGDTSISHKLGSFLENSAEEVETEKLVHFDDEEPIFEYEEPDEEEDENDPFI